MRASKRATEKSPPPLTQSLRALSSFLSFLPLQQTLWEVVGLGKRRKSWGPTLTARELLLCGARNSSGLISVSASELFLSDASGPPLCCQVGRGRGLHPTAERKPNPRMNGCFFGALRLPPDTSSSRRPWAHPEIHSQNLDGKGDVPSPRHRAPQGPTCLGKPA